MKKQKIKTLKLAKQTLGNLTRGQLAAAAGGVIRVTSPCDTQSKNCDTFHG